MIQRKPSTCPLCDKENNLVIYAGSKYNISKCVDCQFLFNSSFALNEEAKEVFSESYYTDVQKEAFSPQVDDYRNDPSAPMFNIGLDVLEKHCSPGRVLDVGSAMGTFLNVARERGWDGSGVEISPFSSHHAREKCGLDIFTGMLKGSPFSESSFDVITFWDSIEHVEDPRENIEIAYKLLKPGGCILFTTDNFDCLIARIAKFMRFITFGLFNYGIERIYIPYNKSYFSDTSFRALLSDFNFNEVYFKKIEYPLSKIKANILERTVLTVLYGLAAIFQQQAQFIIVLKKND